MRLSNSANSVNCVTEDRFSRMLAPAGGLDLGPHCGRKSSVNTVGVRSAPPPKADVGLLDY
jgi:hypothetical protein